MNQLTRGVASATAGLLLPATGVVAVAAGVVLTSAAPALAATACTTADMYAHHTVTPASASGGANVAGAKFGAAAVTGDFNRDGFADVVVGAPNDAVGGVAAGTVSVFPGSAAGISSGKRLTETNIGAGNEAGDRFGAALAVGDFNKDGYADLAVGIPGEAVGSETKSGALGVFMGSSSGLSSGKFLSQTLGDGADEANDAFGTALATGDFNGDGYGDLAIGTPGEAPGANPAGGSVYVYKGSSSGVVKGWTVQQTGTGDTIEAGDQFGAALAAGNVTGSSYTDLVIGAPGEAVGSPAVASGAVYVMPGASSGMGTGFGVNQAGNGGANEAGDRFGAALAVGNFGKASYAAIAVGVPGEAPGSQPASGSVVIIPGASSKLGAGYSVQETQGGETLTAGDKFGEVLATGDVGKDGYSDLLVGAPGKTYGTHTGAGAAFLYQGHPLTSDGRALTTGRRIAQGDVGSGNEAGDAWGSAVALGDVTGDGKADGVIGSPGEAPGSQPKSGTAAQVTNLAGIAATSVPIESFSATTALQASAVPGASVGTVEYAYADNIGRLLHGHQTDPDNFGSVQWTVVSGTDAYTGPPALAEQADGRMTLVAENANGTGGALIQATQSPPVWGSWTALTGTIKSHVGSAKLADGRVVAFAVDPAGTVWAAQQTAVNGVFTSWMSLGITGLAGTPVPVTTSTGIQVFALDTSGVLRTFQFSDGAASGCTSLSDAGLTGTPAVVLYPGNKLRVFVRAADGTIKTKKQDDSGVFPDAWDAVGSFVAAGSPSALISPVTGITEVVVRGADGAIFNTGETWQGSGTWRDWQQASVTWDVAAATDPTAFTLTNSSGQNWAFMFRGQSNQTRVYTLSNASTLSTQTRTAETTGAAVSTPTFAGTTLPRPPR
ncbi:hypothetical protein ABZ807_31745 [Micromonospora sp. NPDC047548]|uniref:hypothetical protein n=1 Tax=Micromonospora sp. NPDC047548 TaxID=3155624 RepID=UPI0033FC6A31